MKFCNYITASATRKKTRKRTGNSFEFDTLGEDILDNLIGVHIVGDAANDLLPLGT